MERHWAGLHAMCPGRERRAAVVPIAIQLHNRMEPLEATWRALEAGNDLSLHQGYDWCRAWAAAHGSRLLIVEGVHAGRTELILPLEIVHHGPVRVARFLGSPFSNINTGLYTEGLPLACHAAGAAPGARCRPARSSRAISIFSCWKTCRSCGADASIPSRSFRPSRTRTPPSSSALLADFDQTLAQINAKRRRKKFRQSRTPAGGAGRVRACRGAKHPSEACATLDHSSSSRRPCASRPWACRTCSGTKKRRRSFAPSARIPASTDAYPLQLHALRIATGPEAGRVVAIAGLSRKGDHVICQFGSIDEGFAPETSPGEFLFHLMIRRLCGEGVALFDFGIGDQAYKRSWCNIETVQHDLLWPTTLAGTAFAGLHRAKAGAKRVIKQNPRLYGFLQRLRSDRAENPDPAVDNQ